MTNKRVLIVFVLLFIFAVSAGAVEQTVMVDIEGMTCSLCAVAVRKSLSKIKGVENAKASFKEKKAWMTVNEEVTDQAITEAVQKAGSYKVKGISRGPVAN